MESRLLEILVCPLCKGRLQYDKDRQELLCRADKIAFPVRDGIPVMLESEARDTRTSETAGPAGVSAAADNSPVDGSSGAA